MSAARPSQAVIRNAIEAWKAAGWPPGRLIIRNGEAIIEPLPEAKPVSHPEPKGWDRA